MIVLDLNLVVDFQTLFPVTILAWNLLVEIWSLNFSDYFADNND
jgi:hypothetical protein